MKISLVFIFTVLLLTKQGSSEVVVPSSVNDVICDAEAIVEAKVLKVRDPIRIHPSLLNEPDVPGKYIHAHSYQVRVGDVIKGKFRKSITVFTYYFRGYENQSFKALGSGLETDLKKGEAYILLIRPGRKETVELIWADRLETQKNIVESYEHRTCSRLEYK